jgi:hypothetical protein
MPTAAPPEFAAAATDVAAAARVSVDVAPAAGLGMGKMEVSGPATATAAALVLAAFGLGVRAAGGLDEEVEAPATLKVRTELGCGSGLLPTMPPAAGWFWLPPVPLLAGGAGAAGATAAREVCGLAWAGGAAEAATAGGGDTTGRVAVTVCTTAPLLLMMSTVMAAAGPPSVMAMISRLNSLCPSLADTCVCQWPLALRVLVAPTL